MHQPIFCCSFYSPQSSPPQCDHIILTTYLVFLCFFAIVLFLLVLGPNFFNGWFRLHVRNNLFCLLNKVPDLTTAMDWFVVCLSMILNPDIIYFQMHLCVSPCFCSRSTFHVNVAFENYARVRVCHISLFHSVCFGQLYAHKRIVYRIKVYIERNNMQVELIRFRKTYRLYSRLILRS